MLPPDWGKTKKLWENNPAAKEAGKRCTVLMKKPME
jgi:hypothetical protein